MRCSATACRPNGSMRSGEPTRTRLFDIAERLPQEAAEALLNLATGTTPAMPERAPIEADPFAHPDAQRRFRVLTNIEELERALDYPWDKWAVFLHPAQRRLVERDYNGPARISGSAGTGKTIVALHRAVALARRHPQARVLLTTFSKALANALRIRLRTLTGNEPEIAARIAVHPVTGIGYDLYTAAFGQPNIAPPALIETLLRQAAAEVQGHRFSPRFLFGEWREVVDAWQLASWEDYRDVARLGRKTRIGGKQREILWSIFERVRAGLTERKAVTWPDLFGRVTANMAGEQIPVRFRRRRRGAGCRGRRIAVPRLAGRKPRRTVCSLPAISVNGFSNSLSHGGLSASMCAGGLIRCGSTTEPRTRSVFKPIGCCRQLWPMWMAMPRTGAAPCRCSTGRPRRSRPSRIRSKRPKPLAHGFQPGSKTGFSRTRSACSSARAASFARARSAVKQAGIQAVELSDKIEVTPGKLSIGTMHLAKGLEFRAVAVMACDDEVIPSQERIENVADDADLEEVYDSERHLLYVACTRARDHLLVTGAEPGSEFLIDLC